MKKVFLLFGGRENTELKKKLSLSEEFEIWNLSSFS